MRKYIAVSKIYIKQQMTWRSEVLFNMVLIFAKILFAYLLWGIIFSERERVGEFTFHMMLSYYIINSFLSQLEMSSVISGDISQMIRNGTFSKYMIIPINIEIYFIAMVIGMMLYYFAFDFLIAFIGIFTFQIQFIFINNVPMVISTFIMVVLGFLFMIQLNYLLGILTLKYEEISTFLMIKNNLVSLITGSIIPLALFPEFLVSIMKLLPFYYITYLPSMLLIGECQDEAFLGIIILFCWCIVIQIIINLIQKRYIRKYDGVGI